MRRRIPRSIPSLLLCLAVAAPLAFGCDALKPKTDAVDGGLVLAPGTPPTATTAAADPTAPAAPVVTTAAPLNPATTPTATTTTPATVKVDAGAVADAAAKSDAAAPAPLPAFPGFDAGILKAFDAGGLLKIPDGGFKPPWQQ